MLRTPDPSVPAVDPVAASQLVAGGALLVDVREQNEWDQVHIPDAELKPMSQLQAWYQDLPRDRPVVVYCRTGIRSQDVVKALTGQAGFSNAVNMLGGIVEWYNQELPVEGLEH